MLRRWRREPVPPEVAFLSEDKSRGLRFDRDGTTVVVTHPRQTTLGLTTLAQVCRGEPSDLWTQRIEEFLAAFDAVGGAIAGCGGSPRRWAPAASSSTPPRSSSRCSTASAARTRR